jgi:hypothetical protein
MSWQYLELPSEMRATRFIILDDKGIVVAQILENPEAEKVAKLLSSAADAVKLLKTIDSHLIGNPYRLQELLEAAQELVAKVEAK